MAQQTEEYTILAELYFKFGLVFDDQDNLKKAKDYYEKSVETDKTINNKYLSSAYSNLASLALEDNEVQTAISYYKKALEADEISENNEGIYDSAVKLAEIYKTVNQTETINFYKRAIEAAKILKDVFYIISSSLLLGDFYFEKMKYEQALKYYDYAYHYAQDKTSKENIERIKIRLNDIKYKIGEKNYENTIEILHSQRKDNE